MKTMLLSATLSILISGSAFARESAISSEPPLHASITQRRAAQVDHTEYYDGVRCQARYFSMAKADGTKATRKSVDCEE